MLIGNGSGGFGLPTTFAAGDSPSAIAAGDFDGDGDVDLATTNYFGNDFTIMLNNGNATFAAPVSYPDGTGRSLDIAIGDIEGDGDLDLVAANQTSESFSALVNNGDGTFTASTYAAAGASPNGVALGDLTGDGILDLAVANFFGYDISLATGKSDGTFVANHRYEARGGPREVAVADFNGDGFLDICAPATRLPTAARTSSPSSRATGTAPMPTPLNFAYLYGATRGLRGLGGQRHGHRRR